MRKPQNFTFLLVALLLFAIVSPTSDKGAIPYMSVFWFSAFTAILVVGVWSLEGERRWFLAGGVLAVASVILSAADIWVGGSIVKEIYLLVVFIFCALTTHTAIRYVFLKPGVDANKLVGAFCVYFLIGVMWAVLYLFVELVTPGAFQSPTSAQETSRQLVYYSFITLTTLGYGDIAPVSDIARTLAYLEALVGQFYLAVMVAGLVGMHVARRSTEHRAES